MRLRWSSMSWLALGDLRYEGDLLLLLVLLRRGRMLWMQLSLVLIGRRTRSRATRSLRMAWRRRHCSPAARSHWWCRRRWLLLLVMVVTRLAFAKHDQRLLKERSS